MNFSRRTSELASKESFILFFVSSKPSLIFALVLDPLSGANNTPNTLVKRDNSGGEIWEWWDQQVKSSDLPLLRAISECKSAKIKLSGSQYYDVVNITDKQKLNIKRCLDYYESLGGTFDL